MSASDPISEALVRARELAEDLGDTPSRIPLVRTAALLANVAARSVRDARVVEPHLDALIILDECPVPVALADIDAGPESTWGVFAAESPDVALEAAPDADGRWRLSGEKPWCSLADRLSHALVTARVDGERRLFAVDLREGVTADTSSWVARGLPDIPSGPAVFDDAVAVPVGDPGWYLARPGFEWGGIRVAACWWGGAASLARTLRRRAAERDSELLQAAAGRTLVHERSARAVLDAAAAAVDSGAAERSSALTAQLVRTTVRRAADAILGEVAQALGPAPAALDPWFAAQTADLSLYLLQDHGQRDEARLGRLAAEGDGMPW